MKHAFIVFSLGVTILAISIRISANTKTTYTNVADLSSALSRGYSLFPSDNPYISHRIAPLAYIDPGTGSFVIQLLLGILFGGLFAFKLYLGSVKGFFRRLFSKKRDAGEDGQ